MNYDQYTLDYNPTRKRSNTRESVVEQIKRKRKQNRQWLVESGMVSGDGGQWITGMDVGRDESGTRNTH